VPTVLFLGASVSQVPAIQQARAAGLRVVAIDGDPNAVGFQHADLSEVVDFSDVEQAVEAAKRHRVDGVVAISTDRAVPVAAAVAAELGLAGIGVDVARRMTDKAAMRMRLEERGIPQPRFAVVSEAVPSPAFFERIGQPAVIKPVDSGGQRGLFRVETYDDFRANLPASLGQSRTGRAILEQYIEGHELNGIAVARGGEISMLTLSDRLRPSGRGFGVGWAHVFPSSLPAGVVERAANVAVAAVEALGLRDGIAFPQLLATEDGEVVVVEVAARIPAGQMADLVRLGIGVDLTAIAFAQALGRPVPDSLTSASFIRPIAIRFFTASPGQLPTGRVLSVDGIDRVRAAPGVLEAGLYLQVGETINPVQVDADRRGYVVATGADTVAALEAADGAARELIVATAED